jgi:protein SCO1/2
MTESTFTREGNRLLISDRFANVPLINHFGQAVRFRDDLVNGRAMIINTMYTNCDGTCPGTSARLQQLRDDLSPLFGRKLVIVSISIDPAADSPRVLREYAAGFDADMPRADRCEWHFLTGAVAAIEELRRSLGFYDLDPKVDADRTRHAAMLQFGNPNADRWAALPSALRKPLLLEAIRRVCGFTFEQRYGIPG